MMVEISRTDGVSGCSFHVVHWPGHCSLLLKEREKTIIPKVFARATFPGAACVCTKLPLLGCRKVITEGDIREQTCSKKAG